MEAPISDIEHSPRKRGWGGEGENKEMKIIRKKTVDMGNRK